MKDNLKEVCHFFILYKIIKYLIKLFWDLYISEKGYYQYDYIK